MIAQGRLPWQLILEFKINEIGRLTFIRRLGILKRSRISQFRFQKVHLFIFTLATSYKHLVNFGSVTLEFKRVKGVGYIPRRSAVWLCGVTVDLAGTEFAGAISILLSFV